MNNSTSSDIPRESQTLVCACIYICNGTGRTIPRHPGISPGCLTTCRTRDLYELVCNGTGRIIPGCPGMFSGCLRTCKIWDLCVLVCNGTGGITLGCVYVGLGTLCDGM